MSRLPFEAFLAFRYLRPRRNFVSVITVISILGVLLGVMVLIVVIAVMSGFDKEWQDRILGFKAHVRVSHVSGALPDVERPLGVIAGNRRILGAAPICRTQIMLKTQPADGKAMQMAPVLLGVDPDLDPKVSVLSTNIKEGRFDFSGHGMIVGCDMAERLHIKVGDVVAVYSASVLEKFDKSRGQTNGMEGAVADEFTIRGIFDVGFGEYNSLIVAVSIEDARELNLMPPGSAEAIQIKLDDPYFAENAASELTAALARDFTLSTGFSTNSFRDIDALAVELRNPSTSASKYLAGVLGEDARAVLADFQPGVTETRPLKERLAADLTRLIRGPLIYTEERFKGAHLRAATRAMLSAPADKDGLILLNRALLQDAIPMVFFSSPYIVTTWQQEDPQIFSSLAVEKTMMFFLLFFIMIVAGFGIVNSQITFVVQKTREIGVLKSLGATNRQVLWLFLSQSVVVAVLGVGSGFGMALLALRYRNEFLFFLRRTTGIEILPSSVYEVYQLPALIQSSDILFICGTAFLTCVLAGLFPAWKASRMQPVEALRYE